MSILIEQIKKELNANLQKPQDFNIVIKAEYSGFVDFIVDGDKHILNTVRLTKTGKVQKNSHRTEVLKPR